MSEKLLCRQISKGKSQSVYIMAHLKTNLKVHENTAHLDNLIYKTTMAKTIYLMSI